MAEGSWDKILQEWLVDSGHCCAAALAQTADYQLYAAAPTANEEGWALVYKDAHTEPIMQDDGNEIPTLINESETLKAAIAADLKTTGPPKNGLWFGGEKYKVIQKDDAFESGESKFIWLLCTRPKKGAHIIVTKASVLVCFYDEEKGQQSGNCKNQAIQMADYLITEGL